LLLLALLGVQSAHAQNVGTVALVMGAPQVKGLSGEVVGLAQGDRLSVGDMILTQSADHVYIQFDDDALVSVRPLSRLLIEEYRYNKADPAASSVKFSLETGVMRSISGEAAKAARDNFRLNTSLAAIGVRGTDFVVDSSPNYTVAAVNEGAILVSPFSAGCLRESVSPCSDSATELIEGASKVIEVLGSQTGAQLRDLQDSELYEINLRAFELEAGNKADQTGAKAGSAANPIITDDELLVPSQSALAARDLAWGRWTRPVSATDKLVLANFSGRTRELVSLNGEYALSRLDESYKADELPNGLVHFDLYASEAEVRRRNGVVSPVVIDKAQLGVDFAGNSFATDLQMSTLQGDRFAMSAAGSIDPSKGRFVMRDDETHIAGGVSGAGAEAGYYFKHRAGRDRLTGITLWDARAVDTAAE